MSNSILKQIGNTPLVSLDHIAGDGAATILAKLESYNPTGSIKDRIALGMVEDAESSGDLGRDSPWLSLQAETPALPWRWWPRPRATPSP